MKDVIALGIHCAHDAAVAICSPEGILCAIQEERLARIKHYYGFPSRALEKALAYCGLSARDIDFVAFPGRGIFYPERRNAYVVEADGRLLSRAQALRRRGWRGWVHLNILEEFGWEGIVAQRRARTERLIRQSWGEFADRHFFAKRQFLADLGLMEERVAHFHVAHHRAHAASAFRLSGLEEACILTVDGKGDGLSGTIYKGHRDGRMELVRSSRAEDSLGNFYQAVTEALGFVPVDSEYKTMGLAALGHNRGAPSPFRSMVQVDDGTFRSSVPWTFRSYNAHNPQKKVLNPLSSVAQSEDFKKLLDTMPQEQLAYFAQEHCEENMLAYARDAMRLTACSDLVGAGGVILNVKANALIRDTLAPSSFFVFPDAGDSGLAAGAAMEALYQVGALSRRVRFRDPYRGHSYRDDEILREIQHYQRLHTLRVRDSTPALMAEILEQGRVIGTFQGRLEMGPRALGNRSVLADPRTEATKDRINLILKGREWFVPFAPAVLEEDAHLYWRGPVDYRYMTFAVHATDYAKRIVPAVVHVDGTMRPQVVSRDFNGWLYEVLRAFKERTGIGVLLNTSFNRHGLPIVGSPEDALEHLVRGWVDGVVVGPWYVEPASPAEGS